MSITKQRQVPLGTRMPPHGFEFLLNGDLVNVHLGDGWVELDGSICVAKQYGDLWEGHRVGTVSSDNPGDEGIGYRPWVRPLPAARAKAKREKTEDVRRLARQYADREGYPRKSLRYDDAVDSYEAGYRACQRRAKGGAK